MIILPNTTDKLQLVTGQAVTVDVVVSYGEVTQASPPLPAGFGRQLSAITTATTTDILGPPGASTTRTPEEMTIRNKHATLAVDVTVQYNANAVIFELYEVTLQPGDTLEYVRGIGFFVLASGSAPILNSNTADVVANAADTYLTGSRLDIPRNRPLAIGTIFQWRLVATKTAAGIAAWTVNVRFGTAGTTADTARLVFTTTLAQTAAVDTGIWTIYAVVRGPISASGVIAGGLGFEHHLAATGFLNQADDTLQAVSAAFDVTTAGMVVGVSCNPGASGVFTFQVVSAQVIGI